MCARKKYGELHHVSYVCWCDVCQCYNVVSVSKKLIKKYVTQNVSYLEIGITNNSPFRSLSGRIVSSRYIIGFLVQGLFTKIV